MSDIQARVDAVVAYLRPIGQDIGRRAKDGDVAAANLITLYTMVHRRCDPASLALLEGAVDDWKKANP